MDQPIDTPRLAQGLRFANLVNTEQRVAIGRLAIDVLGLAGILVERGVLDQQALTAAERDMWPRVRAVREGSPHIHLNDDADKRAARPPADLDCRSLLAICKGGCCWLFPTCSSEDLDELERVPAGEPLGWDTAAPYLLAKWPGNLCVHADPETHLCHIYDRRPWECRIYDCRRDRRLWLDFAGRRWNPAFKRPLPAGAR